MREIVNFILLVANLIGVVVVFSSAAGGIFFGLELLYEGGRSVFDNTIVALLGFLGWTTLQTMAGLFVIFLANLLLEINNSK